LVQILLNYIREENDRSTKGKQSSTYQLSFEFTIPVLDFHQPEEMAQLIDLHIPDHAMPLEELLQVGGFIAFSPSLPFHIYLIFQQSCRDVLRLGVRTGHPRYFNQISQGLDLVGMAGERHFDGQFVINKSTKLRRMVDSNLQHKYKF
jgi:glutamate decarboxylase